MRDLRRSVLVELDLPRDGHHFRLPRPLHQRLQELLDRQDREGRLAPRERRKAAALTEPDDMRSLMRLREERAAASRMS